MANDRYIYNIGGREIEFFPMKEKDSRITVLRSIEPKCCGCGMDDHNKLDELTFTLTYPKITLKPQVFICGDCVEKLMVDKLETDDTVS